MALDILKSTLGDTYTIQVIGEVDVSNADQLRTALDEGFGAKVAHVVVDLSRASYIDSTGIGVLVGAAHRASDAGVAFEVANPQRNVVRVLALLGVDDKLGIK